MVLKYSELDSTITKVKNYINEENPSKEYLLISTKYPKLTLTKIFQCFDLYESSEKIMENVLSLK